MWTIEFYKHVETRRPYNGARLNKSFASVRINKTGNNCLIKDLLCKKKKQKETPQQRTPRFITKIWLILRKFIFRIHSQYVGPSWFLTVLSWCWGSVVLHFFCIDRYYQAKSCDTFRVVYSIRVFERVKAILVGIMFQILFIRSGSTVAWSSLILSGDASQFVALSNSQINIRSRISPIATPFVICFYISMCLGVKFSNFCPSRLPRLC